MTSERSCFAYIVLPGTVEFVTAGRFRRTDTGDGHVGEFVYGRSYRDLRNAVEFDPVELRLVGGVCETARMDGFFGAIRDAMPDYWGRCLIERNVHSTGLTEFDYLMHGPDDRAGALGFGAGKTPPGARQRFNRTLDLEGLQRAADAVIRGVENSASAEFVQARELVLLGTSIGGARPKAVVEDAQGLWIAKFGRSGDRWNHPRVEQGMLTLAKACGLRVPPSRIEKIGGRDVLLVQRFDRDVNAERGAERGYHRHRMVSALTLLRCGDRVGERDSWSYLLFADEVRRASAQAAEDLRELFARMCFNAAVSNLDDHPRNHALVARGRPWRLSPAFDLMPSPVVARERRDLAMQCGRFGRFANKVNLLSGHGRFLLSTLEAEALFKQIVERVRGCWRDEMRRAGVSQRDCALLAPAILYDGLFYENFAQENPE